MISIGILYFCSISELIVAMYLRWGRRRSAAVVRRTNKRLDEVFHSEKIYKSNEDKFCSVAGNTSTERASMVYMGWDKHFDYQLYQSNPPGNI